MTSPVVVVMDLAFAAVMMSTIVAGIYMLHGADAVRRQARPLVLVGGILVALAVAFPLVEAAVGSGVRTMVSALLGSTILLWVMRRRRAATRTDAPRVELTPRQRAQARKLMFVFIAAVVVLTILGILATQAGY